MESNGWSGGGLEEGRSLGEAGEAGVEDVC